MGNHNNTTTTEFGWPSADLPGELKFGHRPASDVARTILTAANAAGIPARKIRSLHPSPTPVGAYQLDAPSASWFVRVSSRIGAPSLESQIVRHLVKAGVLVNVPHAEAMSLEWAGGTYRMDIRPLIEGHHFGGRIEDLTSLGATLRATHSAMAGFSRANEVQTRAARKFLELSSVTSRVKEAIEKEQYETLGDLGRWTRDNNAWLTRMVGGFDDSLWTTETAQCLHGEPHPANVLFDTGHRAWLIDFEDSVHAFGPTSWDLAYVVQRFCFPIDVPFAVRKRRLDAFRDGYGALPADQLWMMRQVCWTSTVILYRDYLRKGILAPVHEFDKFVRLESEALDLAGYLE